MFTATTATILGSFSLLLLIPAILGLARLVYRPAAQRLDGQLAFAPGSENASRLLVVILGLSAVAAVAAMIWRFAP